MSTGTEIAFSGGEPRLESWKEIATYLNRDVRTVQRWEKSEGLPVHRHLHDKLGSVYAFKSEIDSWWNSRRLTAADATTDASSIVDPPNSPADSDAPGTVESCDPPQPESDELATSLSEDLPPADPATKHDKQRHWGIWALIGTLFVAAALATALLAYRSGWKWPPPPQKSSIAVLPFANLSGDPAQEYFSDGLTEELNTQLGRQEGDRLRVVALGTSLAYKNTQKRVKQIASELGVDYVIIGSVRRSADNVRIAVHLVRGADEVHVWDESYDRNLRDVLALQSDVADAVIGGISFKLRARPNPPRSVNTEAYEAYLKGRFFWNKRTPQDLGHALKYFQQATTIDGTYAPAYVGLADCYALLGSAEFGALPPNTAMPLAKQAIMKALELDEGLAEAHASLAYIKLIYDWDWAGADREFRRAIELNPTYPTAHQWYALYFSALGRTDDALAELRKAEQLDPLSPTVKTAISEAYYFARQYEQAALESQRSLEMDPNFVLGLVTLARAREQQGRFDEAIATFDKARTLTGGAPALSTFLAHAYAAKGDRQHAREILGSVLALPRTGSNAVYVPALYISAIYAALGERDQAFNYLDQALQERCEYLIYLDREPMADAVRHDQRFADVLKQTGLKPR